MEKIIHQIWVGPYEIPIREKIFISKLKDKNPTWQHMLWTNDNLPVLPHNIQKAFDYFEKQQDYAHQADILRVFLLKEYGGIYMDIDFDCSGGFDESELSKYDGLFCYHGGNDYTMPNGVFGSTKDSGIINYLLELIDIDKNGWYGPSWLGDAVKSYFGFPRETAHNIVKEKLESINVNYMMFSELERKHIRHHALYSWSPENKTNFANGNINYLMKKVSFVCTSYRRFYCVRRVLAQFYAQTYPNKELIIYNTDMEHPYTVEHKDPNVIIVNNDKDMITGQPYKNRGEICRDAVTYATGEYFMLADDDDIYLPWHIQQAVDGIKAIDKDAWKPEKSFFATKQKLELVTNTMEASVIVKMNRIREIGFRSDLTGYEGLSWYTKLRDEKQLDEHNKNYVPSYCFNWGDPSEIAGHKQSGDINNPNNFENHKQASGDYADGFLTPITRFELDKEYAKYYKFLEENPDQINQEYYKRYV